LAGKRGLATIDFYLWCWSSTPLIGMLMLLRGQELAFFLVPVGSPQPAAHP